MKRTLPFLLSLIVLIAVIANSSEACTSFILNAKDGSIIYGRTCEWGAFDAESDVVLVPRNYSFVSDLGGGKQGMNWKNKYGFIAINMLHKPFYLDGMNEAGLTIGVLFFPGYAKYQSFEAGKESSSLNNADLTSYILGQFRTVDEIKTNLPNLRVVYNIDLEEQFKGTPASLHYVVTDSNGNSIVIEYVEGILHIHDNTIGVMTNSPPYDWQINNLRNYSQLTPYGSVPGTKTVEGINFTPFGAGAGLTGLPGDYTPPSRFVKAFFFTETSIPMENADAAINQASRILDNFDIPKGCVREGTFDKYSLGYTQWSVIGDIKNKKYYWWTEWNRQMRVIDLDQLNFDGDKTISIPLDEERVENIIDRSKDFSTK
ncbi:MAG: choloylglycine hydrolase [Bacteroidetes bacterium]|nr:choloylglycine hydrolase [Bacteroidota bacterium]